MVKSVMKEKLRDAELELSWSRDRFTKRMAKLESRWGHNKNVAMAFRNILKNEASRIWKDGKVKEEGKVKHLERRWGQVRPKVEGLWRSNRIGDR